jgi:tetratricopeptide (TPR) repeat protein
MNGFSNWIKVQLIIMFALIIVVFAFWMSYKGDERLQQAEAYYLKGETASTIASRKEAFNSALSLFLTLNDQYQPIFGTGKLSYNIGNIYYQLGEYPLAIAYYKRAENLMPRSLFVKENLTQAWEKAGISEMRKAHLLDGLLFKFLSLPEKLQLFFGLSLLSFLFISAWLWLKKKWLAKVSKFFLIITAVILLNLAIIHYFSPIEAVLIHAVELRRDAGMEFAKVGDKPIPGGTEIEVVGYAYNEKWLQVIAPNGDFGYIPITSVKLINSM